MAETATEFGQLLERARAGDGAALTRLVEQYEPKVRLLARVLLGAALRPYLDSIDLAQSVHRSVLLGLRAGKFDVSTPDRLVALAVTILRRKVARHWRHLKKQHRLSRCEPAGAENGPAESLDVRADDAPDPAAEAGDRDAARELLSHLTEDEQRMLELRLQGYSTDEIAVQLGLNPGGWPKPASCRTVPDRPATADTRP
jgi:RNA polymerase sigma factor (sigma-70 family)